MRFPRPVFTVVGVRGKVKSLNPSLLIEKQVCVKVSHTYMSTSALHHL